jgi:PAS domain S-box-containing protein
LSLRRKTVFIFAMIFIALLAILNIISWIFILGGYKKLEKDDTRKNVMTVLDAFSDNLDGIDTTLKDWASWDDTYAFIEDANPAYIESNLTDWVSENLELNLIVFVNSSGDIVFGKSFNLQGESDASILQSLQGYISKDGLLLQPANTETGVKGVLLLPKSPLLIASEPILTSLAEGPARGTLIFGRYLDDSEVENLAELVHQNIGFTRIDSDRITPDCSEAKSQLLEGEPTVIRPLSSHDIAGYTLIDDIYGNPALILEVDMPRDIYRQGVTSLVYFTIFLLAACLTCGIAIVLLLEKLVLSRLARLNTEITGIGKAGDLSARVKAHGRDELANLASSINTMMEELERGEEHFRSLIENALDIITILDRDGIVIYESPSVARILGYKHGDFLGKYFFDLVHPEDTAMAKEVFIQVMQVPGTIEHLELRFQHANGSWRCLEVIAYNQLDDPAVGGMVINARDITERKLARERLEKINRLFLGLGADYTENMERIVEASRDILEVDFAAYSRLERGKFSILSTDPDKEGFIVTDRPEDYLSYEIISGDLKEPLIIEDLASGGYLDSCPPAKKRGFKAFVGYPVMETRKTIGCLCVFHTRKREFSWDEIEILGTLARALSVEEERLAQEQSLKSFIDVASHELRHPVTLMKGYALTLRDFGERLDDDAKKNYLTIIGEETDRLDILIKELLDVSRIERGRFILNRQEVRLEPLIERAITEMGKKGFEDRLSLAITDDLGPHNVDPEKLVRVLVILLDNAVNHSPDDSEIEVVAEPRDGEVLISVLDRGVGVPGKDRKLIFERFYQVEDALHHTSPGMGLGLYIAREIVEAHGGRIWYEPLEGGGSIFRFTVP